MGFLKKLRKRDDRFARVGKSKAEKRHQTMIRYVEKLKTLCDKERDCDHGCPLAGYYEDGKLTCTLVQLDERHDFYTMNDCHDWNIKQWSE